MLVLIRTELHNSGRAKNAKVIQCYFKEDARVNYILHFADAGGWAKDESLWMIAELMRHIVPIMTMPCKEAIENATIRNQLLANHYHLGIMDIVVGSCANVIMRQSNVPVIYMNAMVFEQAASTITGI